MELIEKTVNHCCIITINGDIISSADEKRLDRRIRSVFRKVHNIVLDMSEVKIISSSAVQMLLEAWQDIYNEQGLLILACMQTSARITFSINKAYAFLETGTLLEAMEKIKC